MTDTQRFPAVRQPGGAPQEPQLPDLRPSRAERAAGKVLPAAGAVWTAGEILHLTGGHALDTGIGVTVAAAITYGLSGREKIPAWSMWAISGAGAWLTAAAEIGPLHWWPYAPLTWGGLAAAAWVRRWAHRHPAVTSAREHRQARADWLAWRSRRWGLGGSHLVKYEQTRLGEAFEVDTKNTGKRASQLASPHLAERIAEDYDLPAADRVKVSVPRPARIRISIRLENPWAKPVLHPLLDPDAELDFTRPYSIRQPAVIGIDPETGRPLEVSLFDSLGAKNISVVALKGSGKTVVLNALSERVTAAPDAMLVRINLSLKGPAEAYRWGPACHLTAFGPKQVKRAIRVLRAVHGIMEWRSAQYATTGYLPSPEDPAIVVVLDEVDSTMAVPAIRRMINDIATKGREYGITPVRAGQRGTSDYSSAKMRSQDDVFVIGRVGRTGEVHHAAGNVALSMPDMSSYGEGASGVWAVAELDGHASLGRAFLLESEDSARIARERAFTQPGLPAKCREALGDDYEDLLATEVFADWAREQHRQPQHAAAAAHAGNDTTGPARLASNPETDEQTLARLDAELEEDMDDNTRRQIDQLRASTDAKLQRARDIIAETAAMPKPPEVSKEALAAHTAARWRQVGEAAQIPEEARAELRGMLASGTTIREVADKFGISTWTARTWLEKLRGEGAARMERKGRGSRWHLVTPEEGDGS